VLIVWKTVTLPTDRNNTTIRKIFENETVIKIPDKTVTFCQEQGMHILRGLSIEFTGNFSKPFFMPFSAKVEG
jgi:hypothetical protein